MTATIGLWAEIPEILVRAAREIDVAASVAEELPPGPLRGTPEEIAAFLEHNEFELALETLVEIAGRTGANTAFWELIAHAARRMEIPVPEAD